MQHVFSSIARLKTGLNRCPKKPLAFVACLSNKIAIHHGGFKTDCQVIWLANGVFIACRLCQRRLTIACQNRKAAIVQAPPTSDEFGQQQL
jgi:hypothetical protein